MGAIDVRRRVTPEERENRDALLQTDGDLVIDREVQKEIHAERLIRQGAHPVDLLLAGCATVPSAPGVMALPGSAKSADEFRADNAVCRQAAGIDAKATKQGRYDMIYLQCMYSKGNQIPVPSSLFQPTQVVPGSSTPPAGPAATTAPGSPPAN